MGQWLIPEIIKGLKKENKMFWILNSDLKAWSRDRKPSMTAARMFSLIDPELTWLKSKTESDLAV